MRLVFFILGGIEEQFIKYTNPYQKLGKKIDLKVKHTIRVKDLCKVIAKSCNLSNEDIELATYCGLLHDIGRFEQWKRYGTYDDLKSIDHGDLGYELLNEGLINHFTSENHDVILKAVKYHNKYHVPNTLSDRNQLFINITRDADKLDILYLCVEGQLAVKTDNSIIGKKVYNDLWKKKLIYTKDVKSKADEIGVRLGFIFDINFKKSFQIIKENDYINRLLDKQLEEIKNEELKKQIEELRIYVNQYVEEMITC